MTVSRRIVAGWEARLGDIKEDLKESFSFLLSEHDELEYLEVPTNVAGVEAVIEKIRNLADEIERNIKKG